MYANNIPAARQSPEIPFSRLRGNSISPSVTAPETTLMVAKLAASMCPAPRASRQSNELAAKASIAISVSDNVLAVVVAELVSRGGMLDTASLAPELLAGPFDQLVCS